MTAEQLLADFGMTLGLGSLRFDANGCARLMVDGKTAVNFEHETEAGQLQIYVVLAAMPMQGREALFRQLLEANLFGAQTGGAVLALDSQHHEVVLCRAVALEQATGRSLAEAVERLVAAADDWRARIGTAGHAAVPAATALPASPPTGMLRA